MLKPKRISAKEYPMTAVYKNMYNSPIKYNIFDIIGRKLFTSPVQSGTMGVVRRVNNTIISQIKDIHAV